MTTVANTHQEQAWNGYEGRHWADNRDRYDAVNGGMNEPLLATAAIAATDRVLDVGCGTGQTTRLAARRASRGSAVGVDLSAPMLARARATAEAERVGNVTFKEGDAQVFPFPDKDFDVAISRGGVMFFGDPIAAFTNLHRALRPGGRLAFVCARDIGPDDDFARALAPVWALMPEPSGESTPGPTSLADSLRVEQILTTAGFAAVSTMPITVPMVFGHDARDACKFVFEMGPMHYNLQHADPYAVADARAAATRTLATFENSDGVVLHGNLWLVHAVVPS